MRGLGLMALGLAALAATAAETLADTFPSKPIRLVVPYPAGGGADAVARLLSPRLSEALGQSIVIDNRAGASGQVGTDLVARAAPDGHTIVIGPTPLAINPSLFKDIPFDVLKDLEPITLLVSYPFVLVTHVSVPATSVQELIALAKAQPGKLNYASHSSGSATHLGAELLKTMAGVDIVHIPYKGAAPAVQDLVGGHVNMLFDNPGTSMPHVQAGKLRALAVTSKQRSPRMPTIPTVAESGLPGFEVIAWFGMLAPAKTPKAITTRLADELRKVMQIPEIAAKLTEMDYDVVGSTPDEYGAQLRGEVEKWAKVVAASGAKVD